MNLSYAFSHLDTDLRSVLRSSSHLVLGFWRGYKLIVDLLFHRVACVQRMPSSLSPSTRASLAGWRMTGISAPVPRGPGADRHWPAEWQRGASSGMVITPLLCLFKLEVFTFQHCMVSAASRYSGWRVSARAARHVVSMVSLPLCSWCISPYKHFTSQQDVQMLLCSVVA